MIFRVVQCLCPARALRPMEEREPSQEDVSTRCFLRPHINEHDAKPSFSACVARGRLFSDIGLPRVNFCSPRAAGH